MSKRRFGSPADVMQHAVTLAKQGIGRVEPNPAVGAVLVNQNLELIADGYHEKYGGPHAEINAIQQAGKRAVDAILYVTLEPCAHQGKTGPCTTAIIEAGINRVVIGTRDPFEHAGPKGTEVLHSAGIDVDVGLLQAEAEQVIAPFTKRAMTGLPYLHAKWAMTLDGKIASRTGHSQWISNEASRQLVHQQRGRMDGIMIGIETALADDPLLTARPAGPRSATRIVLDSHARLPVSSQLVKTARDVPLLVIVKASADAARMANLKTEGAEIMIAPANEQNTHTQLELEPLLRLLAQREMTNILVEGGGQLLGSLFDQDLIDEYHIFISPKIVGGREATTAMAGHGLEQVPAEPQLQDLEIRQSGHDIYVHGRRRSH